MIKSIHSNSLVMYLQTYLPRQMKRTDFFCVVIFFIFEIDIHYGQKDEPEPFWDHIYVLALLPKVLTFSNKAKSYFR